MTTWILLIWIYGGGASAPAIPVRVDAYKTQSACKAAAEVWRNDKTEYPTQAARAAVCLPGGTYTGVN